MKNIRLIASILMISLILLNISTLGWCEAAVSDHSQSINLSVSYFHSIQNADGGFPASKGGKSSPTITSWVIMALAAASQDVNSKGWSPQNNSPVQFLKANSKSMKTLGDYSRTLMALKAAGQSNELQGVDLAQKISSLQQANGQFSFAEQADQKLVNYHMWAILALASSNTEIRDKEGAKKWLTDCQNKDGGFGWQAGVDSDPDDTAIAVQALVCLGENPKISPTIQNALAYLKSCQHTDGGFGLDQQSNAATDSWTIQGLIAAGEAPSADKWQVSGKDVYSHLRSLQKEDGSFYWKSKVLSSPAFMTAYSLTALTGKTYPIKMTTLPQGKNQAFSDLPSNHWAYQSITDLVKEGIVAGYPDGTFKPLKDVSRAEFVKLLMAALKNQGTSVSDAYFKDVSKSHWAAPYIYAAAQKGYVQGNGNHLFSPNTVITGAELAAIIVRALPSEPVDKSSSTGSLWYSGSVETAKDKGLLYPDFDTNQKVNRAQCAYSIEKIRILLYGL